MLDICLLHSIHKIQIPTLGHREAPGGGLDYTDIHKEIAATRNLTAPAGGGAALHTSIYMQTILNI